MLPRRYIYVLCFSAAIALLFFTQLGRSGQYRWKIPAKTKAPVAKPCTENLAWMKPYDFSYPLRYVSRDIIAVPAFNGSRPSLTSLEEPLVGAFTTIDLSQEHIAAASLCLDPLVLKVSDGPMPPVDASNLIFGLQTTMKRLRATVKHLARWLPHTNARLIAIVIDSEEKAADDKEMAALQKQFHDLGMDVTIGHPARKTDTFAQRYFSLVNVMYAARNDQTEWIAFIDDDTFFPSLHGIQAMVSRYNHEEPQYIGSLSEDWWAVKEYGFMGFGGAGVFLSVPMAKILDSHKECNEDLRTTAGDITVMDCIYKHSSVKLTHVPGLHQIDITGDVSGFYESGREMLSIHHWKEGEGRLKIEIDKMHVVSDICDLCFLQRWHFSNDMVLTNGFSVAEYPLGHVSMKKGWSTDSSSGVSRIDLNEMEATWKGELNVLHSMAPTRQKMNEESKKTYRLLDSVHVGGENGKGIVRQVYFKPGQDDEGERELDSVIVLSWKAGQDK